MNYENFKRLKKYFDNNQFPEIEQNQYVSIFLKLRSISKKTMIEEIATTKGIDIGGKNANKAFEFLFCNEALSENDIITLHLKLVRHPNIKDWAFFVGVL